MQVTPRLKLNLEKIADCLRTNNMDHSLSITSDHIQCSTNDYTVLFGFHSLRLSVVNNHDDTAIVITPCDVLNNDGEVLHKKQTVFHIFRGDEPQALEYDTLNVDSGELFQLGLVHDCTFMDNRVILPLLLNILVNLTTSSIRHFNDSILVQAMINVSEAIEEYKVAS